MDNKTPVISLVERGGKKHSVVMERVTAKNLRTAIVENVKSGSFIHTDESPLYVGVKRAFRHASVNYSKEEYVRKEPHFTVTTNSVESSFRF